MLRHLWPLQMRATAAILFCWPVLALSQGLQSPLIIAHRGASAYLPEHTLAAYQLALDQGADCIETDLVSTSDRQLVARHDNLLNLTTDIAERPEFADRHRSKVIEDKKLEGWFSEDFTLAEIRSLKARERIPELRPESARSNDLYRVPSLQEVLTFIREQEARRDRPICFYPEIKHPSYFDSLGLGMEKTLITALHGAGYRDRQDPVFIQSFEITALKSLRSMTNLKLVQLTYKGKPWDIEAAGGDLSYADMLSPEGLAEIARYADAIGPPKYASFLSLDFLLRADPGNIEKLVQDAHAAGLEVHPWTFRGENYFLPLYLRNSPARAGAGDLTSELLLFMEAGVDGVFTDNPDIGVRSRELWRQQRCQDVAGAQECPVPAH